MKFKIFLLIIITLLVSCATKSNDSRLEKAILSHKEINQIIIDSESEFYPVTINGEPEKLFSDLNDDGIDDLLTIFVKSKNIKSFEKDNLSANYRIYNNYIEATEFRLIPFLNYGDTLEKQTAIPLGKYKILKEIEIINAKDKEKSPLLLSISFGDNQKSITKIIGFNDFKKFSILELKSNTNLGYYFKNIDSDQTPEIIQFKQALLEDGRSDLNLYLYNWENGSFKISNYKTILKELQLYFKKIKTILEFNNTADLLKEAFSSLDSQKYKNASFIDLLNIIFKPIENQTNPIKRANQIDFAEIRENPFPLHNRKKQLAVEIYCRLSFSGINSDSYKATIILNDNPFSDKQYYFLSNQR